MSEEIHIHFENEFDRSGNDVITMAFAGPMFLGMIFFGLILLGSCVA
jgi:hypothetical protein